MRLLGAPSLANFLQRRSDQASFAHDRNLLTLGNSCQLAVLRAQSCVGILILLSRVAFSQLEGA